MHLRTLTRNANLLNLSLLAIAAAFAGYLLTPMLKTDVKFIPPPAKKTAIEKKDEKPLEAKIPSPMEFAVIAENNVFHPERVIPVDKKAEPALPKSEFVLYGTLIADDVSLAYMEDLKAPRSTQGRGKRQTAVKKNATISGYTLKEVEADKVVMVRGEEKITVLLNDPAHTKKRAEATVAAAAPAAEPKVKPLEAARTQPIQQAQQAEPAQTADRGTPKTTIPQLPAKEPPPAMKNIFEGLFKGLPTRRK